MPVICYFSRVVDRVSRKRDFNKKGGGNGDYVLVDEVWVRKARPLLKKSAPT